MTSEYNGTNDNDYKKNNQIIIDGIVLTQYGFVIYWCQLLVPYMLNNYIVMDIIWFSLTFIHTNMKKIIFWHTNVMLWWVFCDRIDFNIFNLGYYYFVYITTNNTTVVLSLNTIRNVIFIMKKQTFDNVLPSYLKSMLIKEIEILSPVFVSLV